jgi:antitoxin MazE
MLKKFKKLKSNHKSNYICQMIKVRQTQIIKIGNSNGIRIPKDFLNALGTKEVVLELSDNTLIIKPIKATTPPRSEWGSILVKMRIEPEDDFNDFDTTLTDGIDDI